MKATIALAAIAVLFVTMTLTAQERGGRRARPEQQRVERRAEQGPRPGLEHRRSEHPRTPEQGAERAAPGRLIERLRQRLQSMRAQLHQMRQRGGRAVGGADARGGRRGIGSGGRMRAQPRARQQRDVRRPVFRRGGARPEQGLRGNRRGGAGIGRGGPRRGDVGRDDVGGQQRQQPAPSRRGQQRRRAEPDEAVGRIRI